MPEIGNQPNQEPVQLAPIPPYNYAPVPDNRPTPGTPLPVQLIHDPEHMTVPKTPVSHSPTRTRTQPFLPARRDPVTLNHPTQTEQPLPYSSRPAPETIRQRENSPENSGKNSDVPKFYPNFSQPKSELTPKSTTSLQPKFTTKLYDKPTERKKRGRQRAKDRNSAADGVRQLFELWWHKASRGVAFGQFYRGHLSDDMRSYYVKEYIYGRNDKSHAEYKRWRAEWDAKHASKTA